MQRKEDGLCSDCLLRTNLQKGFSPVIMTRARELLSSTILSDRDVLC